MIEFDGIFILIGYDGGSDDTLYAVLGTIIWEMLESWGKLYTSCVDRVSRQLVAQLTDRFCQ